MHNEILRYFLIMSLLIKNVCVNSCVLPPEHAVRGKIPYADQRKNPS